MLPSLRSEYAQVIEELEKEEAAIAELEKSDKDYLNELKVSIAEQESVYKPLHRYQRLQYISALRSRHSELTSLKRKRSCRDSERNCPKSRRRKKRSRLRLLKLSM